MEVMDLRKILFGIILCLLLAMLAGCNGNTQNETLSAADNSEYQTAPTAPSLDELSATIVTAGQFWEDWWHMEGIFSHTDGTNIFLPTPYKFAGTLLLPSSGFNSLDEIRAHLLQFYVDFERGLFMEYDGNLFFGNVGDVRAFFPRFDWATATHTMVEQYANRTVVETTVLHGHFVLGSDSYVTLRFHMVDGKISEVEGGCIIYAFIDSEEPGLRRRFAVQLNDGMLYISSVFDSLLESFTNIFEVDYRALHSQDENWGDRLVIWSTMPLFELELITISNEMLGDDLIFIPLTSYGKIDVLLPGQAYKVVNYMDMGTLPVSGFTFLDENGERHYFWMQRDNSDSRHMFFMGRFEDRSDEL